MRLHSKRSISQLSALDDYPFCLITFRPEFEPAWNGLPHVESLVISRLGRDQVEALVDRLSGARKLPTELIQQIVAKTDGVPLFVEELTRNKPLATLEDQPFRAAPGMKIDATT